MTRPTPPLPLSRSLGLRPFPFSSFLPPSIGLFTKGTLRRAPRPTRSGHGTHLYVNLKDVLTRDQSCESLDVVVKETVPFRSRRKSLRIRSRALHQTEDNPWTLLLLPYLLAPADRDNPSKSTVPHYRPVPGVRVDDTNRYRLPGRRPPRLRSRGVLFEVPSPPATVGKRTRGGLLPTYIPTSQSLSLCFAVDPHRHSQALARPCLRESRGRIPTRGSGGPLGR